jgi:hypothetical protein
MKFKIQPLRLIAMTERCSMLSAMLDGLRRHGVTGRFVQNCTLSGLG